jgi:hypothetical protein|tara:strand:- start:57 stop:665 length:609 start_codon:yes stop_codon:yes gene_type:complete
MVRISTLLTIGGIGLAYILFKNAGGASGIGSSIGGGLSNFANSITGSLSLNPFANAAATNKIGFYEDGQFFDTSGIQDAKVTPQERQASIDKQNNPNYANSRWEEVITEVCTFDANGNKTCRPYDGSGILNEIPQSEKNNFTLFPEAFGQAPVDLRNNQSFANQGKVSGGYEQANYSQAGAGYNPTNFFGGNPNTYVNPWSK